MTSGTRDRRGARSLALEILYQADIRDELPMTVFSQRETLGWDLDAPGLEVGLEPPKEVLRYARLLVSGVQQHAADIDSRIAHSADRWALDRMPVVDRNLLRLAVFELTHTPDVPVAVVINEAIELAKTHSTEESGRFVNGVLGRVAGDRGDPPR